ncbi:MAG: signal peptide peptidase SppA [Elainellaceae cyanobacterium]
MRDFFKYTLASLTGSILFFILFMGFVTIGAIGLIGALIASLGSRDRADLVDPNTVLVYDLSMPITDSEQALSPSEAFFEIQSGGVPNQLSLRDAVNAFERAATDDRIVALYLTGSDFSVGTGGAILAELRGALNTFRESGKPILAYDISWDEREYYLASVAETIYLNPFGDMEMNGLFAEVMYQAEALQKLGVGIQVTRVGQYKSAVEPFTRNSMSPEEREQLQGILSDIWGNILETSSEYRSLDSQQFQAIADDQGLLFGDAAETAGLVDQVAYLDEVVSELRELTGETPDESDEGSFRQVNLGVYADAIREPRMAATSENQIAVVYAEGAIVAGTGEGLGQVIASERLAKELRDLRQDDAVKAIVLRVNSPGGSATASEIILRELQLAVDEKPVIVSMGDVAASGGYWISTYASQIFAEPTTITGSIGVFGAYINLQELGDKIGVNWDVVKTGDTADIFTITRPKTEKEIGVLQQAVDQIYDAFLERVSEGRNIPLNRVSEIAQGRVWSGQAAQELGLVDELGGLEDAIQAAAEMADLGDTWQIREYPEGDRWQQFFEQFGSPRKISGVESVDPLSAQFERFKDEITVLKTMNDPRHIYARMPYRIEFK